MKLKLDKGSLVVGGAVWMGLLWIAVGVVGVAWVWDQEWIEKWKGVMTAVVLLMIAGIEVMEGILAGSLFRSVAYEADWVIEWPRPKPKISEPKARSAVGD